jgi:hypothetical protein
MKVNNHIGCKCGLLKKYMSLLQKSLQDDLGRHTRENGYPEAFVFQRNWIPDYYLGNDKTRLLQETHKIVCFNSPVIRVSDIHATLNYLT